MTNEVQVFNFEQMNVRTVEINDEVWFVATDVANALGLSNVSMSIKALDDDERSKFNLGRQGETNVISEAGLYRFIGGSRKKEAKQFMRWVNHEVLPTIRKTGSYQAKPALRLPQTNAEMLQVVQNVNEETNKRIDEVENSVSKLTDEFGLPNKSAGKLRNYGNQRVTWWLGGKNTNAYQEISSKVFAEFWHDLKMYFGGLSSYKDLPMKDITQAEAYIQNWHPSTNTQAKISELNSQTELDV